MERIRRDPLSAAIILLLFLPLVASLYAWILWVNRDRTAPFGESAATSPMSLSRIAAINVWNATDQNLHAVGRSSVVSLSSGGGDEHRPIFFEMNSSSLIKHDAQQEAEDQKLREARAAAAEAELKSRRDTYFFLTSSALKKMSASTEDEEGTTVVGGASEQRKVFFDMTASALVRRVYRPQTLKNGTTSVSSPLHPTTSKRSGIPRKESSLAVATNHPPEWTRSYLARVYNKTRAGALVLGMHRSGTSMITGLLIRGPGYRPGGHLKQGSMHNEQGYFELESAVVQNMIFLRRQGLAGLEEEVIKYDVEKTIKGIEKQRRYHIIQARKGNIEVDPAKIGFGRGKLMPFKSGNTTLNALNNHRNFPYLVKDPRLCLTLKAWLPGLHTEPAILFTYRHPLAVAKSLVRRHSEMSLEDGFWLWIVYNQRALQNSQGLCRVVTSSEAVIAKPHKEIERIIREMTNVCQVPPPPERVTDNDIKEFIDLTLQHNSHKHHSTSSNSNTGKGILARHGDCVVHDFKSDYIQGSKDRIRERDLYLQAMKLYCDFESRKAFRGDYNEWPALNAETGQL